MDKLTYSRSNRKAFEYNNTLPFQGFQNASKLVEIFNILNSPIRR